MPVLNSRDQRICAVPTKGDQAGHIRVRKNTSVSIYLAFIWQQLKQFDGEKKYENLKTGGKTNIF